MQSKTGENKVILILYSSHPKPGDEKSPPKNHALKPYLIMWDDLRMILGFLK